MTDFLNHSEYLAMVDDLLAICRTGRFICLYPHMNADGDALGSSLAMALVLQKLGAKVAVLTDEPIPEKMFVLPEKGRVLAVSDPDEIARLAAVQDLALGLDSPGGKRLGCREIYFAAAPKRFIIDHHIPGKEPKNACVWLDVHAAATCELVGYLILDCERRLGRNLMDRVIATTLMVGLLTDTGRFTYSCTRPETMQLAGELLRHQVAVSPLASALFEERSLAKSRLQGYVGLHTQFAFGQKFAFCVIPRAFIENVQAVETDFEGIVSEMRHIEGVEVAVLIRHTANGQMKGSVRTSDEYDAQKIAAAFGGGGHIRAAGLTVASVQAEDELFAKMIEVVQEQFGAAHE